MNILATRSQTIQISVPPLVSDRPACEMSIDLSKGDRVIDKVRKCMLDYKIHSALEKSILSLVLESLSSDVKLHPVHTISDPTTQELLTTRASKLASLFPPSQRKIPLPLGSDQLPFHATFSTFLYHAQYHHYPEIHQLVANLAEQYHVALQDVRNHCQDQVVETKHHHQKRLTELNNPTQYQILELKNEMAKYLEILKTSFASELLDVQNGHRLEFQAFLTDLIPLYYRWCRAQPKPSQPSIIVGTDSASNEDYPEADNCADLIGLNLSDIIGECFEEFKEKGRISLALGRVMGSKPEVGRNEDNGPRLPLRRNEKQDTEENANMVNVSDLNELLAMGFDHQRGTAALSMADHQLNKALDLLLESPHHVDVYISNLALKNNSTNAIPISPGIKPTTSSQEHTSNSPKRNLFDLASNAKSWLNRAIETLVDDTPTQPKTEVKQKDGSRGPDVVSKVGTYPKVKVEVWIDIEVGIGFDLNGLMGNEGGFKVLTVPVDAIEEHCAGGGIHQDIFKACRQAPELIYPSPLQQLIDSIQRLGGAKNVKPGDVLLTRHSNLSGYKVLAHLIVPSNITDPILTLGSTPNPTTKAIKSILRLMTRLGFTKLSLPIVMSPNPTLNVSTGLKRVESLGKPTSLSRKLQASAKPEPLPPSPSSPTPSSISNQAKPLEGLAKAIKAILADHYRTHPPNLNSLEGKLGLVIEITKTGHSSAASVNGFKSGLKKAFMDSF